MAGSSDRFSTLVPRYIGDSEKKNSRHLGELLARGIDDPDKMVHTHSDCGTFVLGIWWAAGVQHPLLMLPYQSQMAIGWVLKIARDKGALRRYPHDMSPVPWAVCHYKTKYLNNDHVLFLEKTISPGVTSYIGAGGAANSVGRDRGPITWNWGRPLVEWVDPIALLADATEPRDESLLSQLYLESLEVPSLEVPTHPEASPTPLESLPPDGDNNGQVGHNG